MCFSSSMNVHRKTLTIITNIKIPQTVKNIKDPNIPFSSSINEGSNFCQATIENEIIKVYKRVRKYSRLSSFF